MEPGQTDLSKSPGQPKTSRPDSTFPETSHNRNKSSSSSSGCSLSDGDDDFFQIDTAVGFGTGPEAPHPSQIPLQSHDAKHLPPKSPNSDLRPPIHPRTDVPDPNRIPLSIFARTSNSPMDWSVASNDSLFSIPMADQAFLCGIQEEESSDSGSTRSSPGSPDTGDSPVRDSYPTTRPVPVLSPLPAMPPSPPVAPVSVPAPEPVSPDTGDDSSDDAESTDSEGEDEVARGAAEEQEQQKGNIVGVSEDSSNGLASCQSFAFPILTGHAKAKRSSVQFEPEHQEMLPKEMEQHKTMAAPAASPPHASPTPAAKPAEKSAAGSWFSCFCCCCR